MFITSHLLLVNIDGTIEILDLGLKCANYVLSVVDNTHVSLINFIIN